MELIINADDLGGSKQINDTVFDLMSQNIVTSATIMANGPFFKDAVERIPHFKNCSFGVHLNATQFKPLTNCSAFKNICDCRGEFSKNFIDMVGQDSSLRQGIFKEWCEQIKITLAKGINISHIDSHMHVHTIPCLFLILKKIQKIFKIKKVRISKNIYSSDLPALSNRLLCKKFLWNNATRLIYKTKTTSGFTDFKTFLKSKIKEDQYNSIEIMVHPSSRDTLEETNLLQTSWMDNLPYSVKLINYNDL